MNDELKCFTELELSRMYYQGQFMLLGLSKEEADNLINGSILESTNSDLSAKEIIEIKIKRLIEV